MYDTRASSIATLVLLYALARSINSDALVVYFFAAIHTQDITKPTFMLTHPPEDKKEKKKAPWLSLS